MQRRHAIIAAIALVALVLIPAAALASGPGGFGHRGSGPGPKSIAQDAPDRAVNGIPPNWSAGNRTGARDCAGDAGCLGTRTFDGNATPHRGGDCPGNLTGNRTQDGTRLHDRGFADQANATGTAPGLGPQGRAGRCR